MGMVLMLCGASLAASVPETPAPSTALDKSKDKFAALMAERGALAERARASSRTITTARSTTGRSGGAATASGQAYRAAALRVEQALNAHPRIKALQEEYAAAQEEKIAFSQEQSAFLTERRQARKAMTQKLNARLTEANKRAERDRASLLKKAKAKTMSELTPREQKRWQKIQARVASDIAKAREAYAKASDDTAAGDPDDPDSFAAQLAAFNAQYKAFEQEQADLKDAMQRLRKTLRSEDPEIAALQLAAQEASRVHVVRMDARSDVVAARVFLRSIPALRAEIDKQARPLRQAILKADPDCKPKLDKLAASGGLAQVGEDFWTSNE
ncbi:MAG: hypothetical protein QGH29_03385 [Kiritimatiellia bacterium]|nr:hypothetical protein [Kiritimatiellia bacterium]